MAENMARLPHRPGIPPNTLVDKLIGCPFQSDMIPVNSSNNGIPQDLRRHSTVLCGKLRGYYEYYGLFYLQPFYQKKADFPNGYRIY
jgi:hypothetical protein